MKCLKPVKKNIQGLSLIELMIAMVLGLVLMLGVIQVFSASQAAYRLSEGIARNQENARFAFDYLESDVRMAGHYGCVNDQSQLRTNGAVKNWVTDSSGVASDFTTSIQGYEATNTSPNKTISMDAIDGSWMPALPASIASLKPLPGTDILVMHYLAGRSAPISNMTTANNRTTMLVARDFWDSLTFDGNPSPSFYGVANCGFVDFFKASSVNPNAGSIVTESAITRYGDKPSIQTRIFRAESIVYYLAKNTDQEPSLYRARFDGKTYQPEELVAGVENMQFIYGQDQQKDILKNPPTGFVSDYAIASQINGNGQWLRVGSVQIGLLMRSPDSVSADPPQSFKLLGLSIVPSQHYDEKLRTTYEITIALRNRLYGN